MNYLFWFRHNSVKESYDTNCIASCEHGRFGAIVKTITDIAWLSKHSLSIFLIGSEILILFCIQSWSNISFSQAIGIGNV